MGLNDVYCSQLSRYFPTANRQQHDGSDRLGEEGYHGRGVSQQLSLEAIPSDLAAPACNSFS